MSFKTRATILPAGLLLSAAALAQSPAWTYTSPDTLDGVLSDSAGNLIVLQQGGSKFTKISSDGQLSWTFTTAAVNAWGAQVDVLDDIVIAQVLPASTTIRIQKLSGIDGSLRWSTTHAQPGTYSAYARGLASSANGDCTCLVHYALPGPPAVNRTTLLRFDAAGNLVWDTFASAPDTPQGADATIAVDAQGGVFYQEYFGGTDWRLFKVDGQGHVAWSYAYADPRGPDYGPEGLTVDAQGVAHWYIKLSSTIFNALPTVEVRVDPNGNLLGTHDVTMLVDDVRQAGHRIAHIGRAIPSQDMLLEVRDDAGQLVWSASVPQPSGFNYDASWLALDVHGGAEATVQWQTPFLPHTTLVQKRHYDSSGHVKWIDGPGQAPFAPDASMIGWTTGPASFPTTITKYDLASAGFCFGDGTLGSCPCGNGSAIAQQAGCANSLGSGASLTGSGAVSLAADALVLSVQGATGSALLVAQGSAFAGEGAGIAFGDGLRCIGGTLVRVATRPLAGGSFQYPQAGDVPISVRGGVSSPGTRTYQGFYRNNAAFCTASTQNTTNGVIVHWLP